MKVRLWKSLLLTYVVALSLLVFSDHYIPQQLSEAEISIPRSIDDHRRDPVLTPLPPSPARIPKFFRPNSSPALAKSDSASNERVQSLLSKLPLYFIENQGQLDERVAYYLPGGMTSIYFSAGGLTYSLTSWENTTSSKGLLHRASFTAERKNESAPQRWALKVDFVGANPNVNPKGQDLTQAVVSYFKGPKEQWKTGVKTYSSVVYEDLWPGIDLIYAGSGNRLKYTFMVKPGADPDQIKLAYRGAKSVRLTESGQMEVMTPAGGFTDDKPLAWQEDEKKKVDVAYTLNAESAGGYAYGFRVGNYDKSKPLVLDPVVLVYSSYFGGANTDVACCIAVDSQGNAYLAGRTNSDQTTFPETVGSLDAIYNGGTFDAFVAKVNTLGTGLVYAGYIGGGGDDEALGIAVDSQGNAYVTGFTDSSQNFPLKVGPDLINNGEGEAFIAKVNTEGTDLIYSGYIGGNGTDQANSVAVDAQGFAYVAGFTNSGSNFPIAGGLGSTYNGGFADAFVVKVSSDGKAFVYGGFIGGAGNDQALGVALQPSCAANCNAFVTGFTDSAELPFSTFTRGGNDAFVAKVKADGSGLDYIRVIGDTGSDFGLSIAVDTDGDAYVMGHTSSNNFDVSNLHPIQPPGGNLGPNKSAYFVTKVNPTGSGLLSATLLGGSPVEFIGADQPGHIAVDSAGNAYVTGLAQTSNFPITTNGALQPLFGGSASDAFVAKLDLSEGVILYSTFLGGNGADSGTGIAVDASGAIYVTGSTASADFPKTSGVFQSNLGGGTDAFVAKISSGNVPLQFVTFPPDLPSLPVATLKQGYSGNIGIGGGEPRYTVEQIAGSLPDDLDFASPTIHGTPTGPTGTSIFRVRVTDQAGAIEGQFYITVCSSDFELFAPYGTVTVDEDQTFVACGGFGTKKFNIPINNSNANITANGTYTAGKISDVMDTVQVTDAKLNSLQLAVQVVPKLQILPTDLTLLAGTQGDFDANGGVGNKTFSILNQKPSGTIDPVTGLYSAGFTGGVTDTVQVADDNGNTSNATVNVVNLPQITIAATNSTASEQGATPGAFTVSRTGGITASALTVHYTVSGTAAPGIDYQTLSGNVVIPSSQGFAQIVVTPNDDGDVEGNESVIATLTANAAYTVGTPSSATVTITDNDTALLDTFISSGPAPDSGGATNSVSASFSFSSTDPASTFECSLNGAAFVACTNPKTYPKLKVGNYNFRVQATAGGITDPTPASFDWMIDNKAPNTTITSRPPSLTNNPQATFEFSSTEPEGTFQCSMDGGAFAPCTSPFTTDLLGDGKHAFQVKAIDLAGNADKSAAKAKAWTVDTTPPETTLTATPATPTTSTSAAFKFTSTEKKSTFQCNLDGAGFASCKSGQSFSGLSIGVHNFQVLATDAAGNIDPTPASFDWTIQ